MARQTQPSTTPMVHRVKPILLALLGCAALVGIYRYSHRNTSASESSDAGLLPSPPLASVLRWEAGKRYVYALQWKGDSHVPFLGTHMVHATADMEADLAVRALGEEDGVQRLVVSLENVKKHAIKIGGQATDNEPKKEAPPSHHLEGHEALVRVDSRGIVQSIAFRPTTPPEIREVLRRIVQAMQVSLPEGAGSPATWDTMESTPTGTAQVRYRRSSHEPNKLLRTRLAYSDVTMLPKTSEISSAPSAQKLASKGTILFDSAGALQSIDDSEDLKGKTSEQPFDIRSTFSLERREVTSFNTADVQLSALSDSKAEETQLDLKEYDRQYAERVKPETIVPTIRGYGIGSAVPDGFVPHTAAYLRLNPEKLTSFSRLFREPTTKVRSRELILDILTVAGDASAQQAFRQAITSPIAREGDSFGIYVQRFMFIRRPTRETAQLLLSIYEDAHKANNEAIREPTAVTLGGVARNLFKTGEKDLAAQFRERIRADLAQAKTSDQHVALLSALGNAAMPEDIGVIASYAQNNDVGIRSQVAFSMRYMDTPTARAVLVTLAQDPSPIVASTAWRALRKHTVALDEWANVAALVTANKTLPDADLALVEVLQDHLNEAEGNAETILRHILARSTSNPDLAATIRQMLGMDEN